MIKGTTRVCGLIGNPVEHSLSPAIHNTIANVMGIDLAYVTFKVEDDVESAIKGAYELNILGMNVTVPWKQRVIASLKDIDEAAKRIGAVNTLVRTEGGFKGYNTDILGFERELLEEGVEVKNNTVVILGAGGAARSIAVLMAMKGAGRIYMLNRTVNKAQDICETVRTTCSYDNISALEITDYKEIKEKDYIVIQTTSVGLYPNVDAAPIFDKEFYDNAYCGVDIIYNPAKTKFMSLMEQSGKKNCNGLKMLIYQAVAAFELWNNVTVSKEAVDSVVKLLGDDGGLK